jgi:4-alpha-glucanotransferase
MAYASPARTAIVAMQDFLGLGPASRMNVPGVASGNWCWRMEPKAVPTALAPRIRALAADSGRLAK